MSRAAARAEPRLLEGCLELLRSRVGLKLPASRRPELARALAHVLPRRIEVADALRLLQQDRACFDALVAAITIGETYFFRDPAHFDHIRDCLLPERLRRNGPQGRLACWSAGCASGEEAYSLAALLADCGLGERSSVLATDVSAPQLARAEAGEFGAWSLRGEGRARMARHLLARGERYRLAAGLRGAVRFAVHNLASGLLPPQRPSQGFDLILCRNVLIYFDAPAIASAACTLHAALAPGGYLLTGPSDPLLGEHAPLETLLTPVGILYRRPDPAAPVSTPPAGSASNAGAPTLRAIGVGEFSGMGVAVELPPSPAPEHVGASPAAAAPAADQAAPSASVPTAATGIECAIDASAAAPSSPASARAAQEYREAMACVLARDFEGAERALRRTLYLDSSLALAHFSLGCTRLRLGRPEAARRAFRSAASCLKGMDDAALLPLGEGARVGELARALASRLQSPACGGEA